MAVLVPEPAAFRTWCPGVSHTVQNLAAPRTCSPIPAHDSFPFAHFRICETFLSLLNNHPSSTVDSMASVAANVSEEGWNENDKLPQDADVAFIEHAMIEAEGLQYLLCADVECSAGFF